jgi:hypothetical protein
VSPKNQPITILRTKRQTFFSALVLLTVMLAAAGLAQNMTPFAVANPKNKKWSAEEAARIYFSTCDLVARSVRPEKPPLLRPKFVLVLGSDNDEFVNLSPDMEVHLKSWNAVKFAEAVALIATREVVQPDDLKKIVQQSVALANASVSVKQLRQNR